ncbi:MAG: hypothetical protein ABI263_05175, partial [Gelidibacter sp.]
MDRKLYICALKNLTKKNIIMQNKGLVKLFAVLFGLVSIYQLSFTFKANQIEDRAEEIAARKSDDPVKRAADEASYLDS